MTASWHSPLPDARTNIPDAGASSRSKAVTTSVTKTPRDGSAQLGMDAMSAPLRLRRTVTGETRHAVWDRVSGAHNPEVAGSNPAPATNVVAGQRPFPIGRGPLACVARDQIRDQITGQRRLSRPAPSQAERCLEIRGTYCNGSEHLGRGRRVETQRSHLGPGSQVSECHPQVVDKIGADGVIVVSSSSQVR